MMPTITNINDALNQLQAEINSLTADLNSYSKRPKASEKYIMYKQIQIEVFKAIQITIVDLFNELNAELKKQGKKLQDADEKITILEGVCLLHGVHDINSYFSYSPHQITNMVLDAWKENWRQTPSAFFEKTEQNTHKFSDKPVYDFNTLLNAAKNNRNYNVNP